MEGITTINRMWYLTWRDVIKTLDSAITTKRLIENILSTVELESNHQIIINTIENLNHEIQDAIIDCISLLHALERFAEDIELSVDEILCIDELTSAAMLEIESLHVLYTHEFNQAKVEEYLKCLQECWHNYTKQVFHGYNIN